MLYTKLCAVLLSRNYMTYLRLPAKNLVKANTQIKLLYQFLIEKYLFRLV